MPGWLLKAEIFKNKIRKTLVKDERLCISIIATVNSQSFYSYFKVRHALTYSTCRKIKTWRNFLSPERPKDMLKISKPVS